MLAAILEQGVPIDALDGNNKSFLTYESNVLFALRFMVDTDIVGGNWVRYPAMSLLTNAHAAGTVLYKIDDAQASCRAVHHRCDRCALKPSHPHPKPHC